MFFFTHEQRICLITGGAHVSGSSFKLGAVGRKEHDVLAEGMGDTVVFEVRGRIGQTC